MKVATTLIALASMAMAFPRIRDDPEIAARAALAMDLVLETREAMERRDNALGISKHETNCGPVPCPTFSESDQFVSTTGQFAYQSPAVSDIRGPCPGLNAAANHGYLPRSGIASIEETISGLSALYNLDPNVVDALAAYAVAIDGNVLEGVWSIGGPLPTNLLGAGVIGTGQGLSYSHNNYEGDSSIGRSDAYTNNGDAHSLNITKFEGVYAVGGKEDRYTLDKFRQRFQATQDESIANNPYYFTGLFSTVVVVPAAYNFVINLMSNHSAEEPSGYLDGHTFKSFFGVTGKPGKFVWQRGQERVPDYWYRRPSYNTYTAQFVVGDVAIGYQAYPKTLKIGGNTGTTNSFTGVNVEDLTNGAYNAKTLFNGNNFGCFAFELLQNGLPDFIKPDVGNASLATDLVNKALEPILGDLGCPKLSKFDQGLFNKYPGRTYSPTGPDTNYKA